ncbi:helicase-exonuclease AddAB subunit AddB [Listeria sp. PSOL-1]|uniref:helicase-exonuclease AddAB subunit AddB n=1 Tax=Listeria sp. PSOL-1 TaxID=1844999 RepID=UPI00351BC9C7
MLQLITGEAGSGKTTNMIQDIKQKTETDSKTQIIIIVPEQMTFQMETYFLDKASFKGMMNVQVYSFSRLAFRVLQETGGLSNTFLTNTGMEMLVKQVLFEEQDWLKLFTKSANKKGFCKELLTLFKEMKQYEVTDDALASTTGDKGIREKVRDVAYIYQKYQEKLFGKYLEQEDYLRLFSEQIQESEYIQNAYIYIDGFDYFSTQELTVIGQLLSAAKEVILSLTLRSHQASSEYDMFQLNLETMQSIRELALKANIPEKQAIHLSESKKEQAQGIKQLVQTWGSNYFSVNQETAGLHLHQANNRRSELEGIAREIRRLVMSEQYQYRDIALLIRNNEDYDTLIEPIMEAEEIPYFFDKKRSMAKHPLIEFIRSSLDAIRWNWQYDYIFQAVRTEFFNPIHEDNVSFRSKVDLFENYLLENGIYNKSRWFQSEKWYYRKIRGLVTKIGVQTDEELAVEATLAKVRKSIEEPLLFLEKGMSSKKTGRELATLLYDYLILVDAPNHLEQRREKAEEEGLLELAKEHEQAWNSVITLLDELVDLQGDSEMMSEEFCDLVQTGLEAMEFSLLPPAIDQLVISDIANARLLDMKVIFVAGLNDGVLPRKVQEEGIFSNRDREVLEAQGIQLKPSNKKLFMYEEFIAYRIFSLPQNELYLSYPAADEEGRVLAESTYLRKLKSQFPNLKEEIYLTDPALLSESEQKEYISSKKATLTLLTKQLQRYKNGYAIHDIWWDIYNYFIEQDNLAVKKVLAGLNYQNKVISLTEKTATALFGEKIHASVSRMEKFFSCQFQHFAQYGLKLEERATYQLQPVDIGEVFHGAMEWISVKLEEMSIDWGDLDASDCETLATQAMNYLAPKLQHEILLSSNRMAYIKYKLLNIITRTTKVLNEQAKISGFKPIGLEINFGLGGKIPPMKIPLKQNHELLLQGRIDRIDQAESEGRAFLRIIDYKSSAHDLSLPAVYYGISLQMLTYLDVVTTNAEKLVGKTAEPAGVLYFHMHNQRINASLPLTDQELQNELQKSYRMKGLILSDPVSVNLMDETLENGKSSLVVPAELKKDGLLSSRSKTATKEQFDQLRHFIRGKYQEAGNQILNGKVFINPYKLRDATPCHFCPFRSVCQFDPATGNDHYRYFKNEKPSIILEKMKHEGDDGNHEA